MKPIIADGARQISRRHEWTFPSVDQIMAEERATAFKKRSIKTSAKLSGLKLAVSMMDLTTLEGKDTPGKVAFLCPKRCSPLIRAMTFRRAPQFAFIPTW